MQANRRHGLINFICDHKRITFTNYANKICSCAEKSFLKELVCLSYDTNIPADTLT